MKYLDEWFQRVVIPTTIATSIILFIILILLTLGILH